MTRFYLLVVLLFVSSEAICQSVDPCAEFSKLKDYEIIAFGEACHGAESDYRAREQMIDCLLTHTDSIDVMVEMFQSGGVAIQKYRDGIIDADSLIDLVGFYGLQTNSFLHLINKFKDDKRVTFYGVDMQSHRMSLLFLQESILTYAPDTRSQLTPIVDSLNHNFLRNYSNEEYIEYMGIIERNISALENLILANESNFKNLKTEIHYPLRIIKQHLQMLDYLKHDDDYISYNLHRDSCMANNVAYLKEGSDKQIVIFAANGHLMAQLHPKYQMMGGHLKMKFEGEYFVITSQYYQGVLLEVRSVDGKRTILEKELPPSSDKKSMTYQINETLHPTKDTLIMVTNPSVSMKKFFKKRKQFGQVWGTGRQGDSESLSWFRPDEYDAIYYIVEVEASINIRATK